MSDGDFDAGITLPEYFEVTADVTDFTLDMTMTVVMNAANFIHAEGGSSLSLEDELNSLTDATGRLEDGSAALADGVDTLKSKLGEFQNGMNTLADGVSSLQNGAGSLADGANALNTSAQAINNGIAALDTTLRTALTEEEKAAYAAQAQASVDATFAPGTDTYNMIFNSAKQSFADAMNQSTGIGRTVSCSRCLRQSDCAVSGAVCSVVGTGIMQYAQGQGLDLTQMSVADYQAALAQFRGANQAAIHEQVMAGLETIASGVTGGIAAQGADTTAAGVVSACQQPSSRRRRARLSRVSRRRK